MPDYQVLILYRPPDVLDCTTLLPYEAADVSVQIVDAGLRQAGIATQIALVGQDIETFLAYRDPRQTVIFNYCDGYHVDESGYDPITRIYEAQCFAYTGADDQSLWLGRDKQFGKNQLVKHGIPTPEYQIYETDDVDDWTIFPALVKPSRLHASLGIGPESVVDNPDQLKRQVQYVLDTFQQPALVEDFIEGEEYRVSVWGGKNLVVLPFIGYHYLPNTERRYGFKDYETKWSEDHIRVDIPAQVEPNLAERISDVAKKAFRAVLMRDYGGIDIRVRGDVPYVIDPNPNPDISTESSFDRAVRAAGQDYSHLVTEIVRLAAKRRPKS